MKKYTFPALIFILVLFSSNVIAASVTEDFEDDTLGANPTGDYTYTEDEVGSDGCSFQGSVVNDGSSQAFRIVHDSGVITPPAGSCINEEAWVRFDFIDTTQIESLELDYRCDTGIADAFFQIRASNEANIDQHFYDSACLRGTTANDTYHSIRWVFNWNSQTYDYFVDDVLVNDDRAFDNPSATDFRFIYIYTGGQQGDSNTKIVYMDNLVVGDLPIVNPPAGMKAQVIDNDPGDEIVFVQWLSSPTDDGTYDYELYANSVLIATRTAGEDVDGVWSYTHNGDLVDSVTYHTVAISFIASNNSCTVTINTTNQGNTDSCGSPIPGFEEAGSDLTGPNGALFGGSRSALATALQISESSLGFLIGAFLTMLLTAGLYFYFKVIGGIIGAVIGLTISYSTNLLPAWSLYVLIFTTLAGVILWTRTRPMRGM